MALFLIHIGGAAALLIWAVRLVRTGVERAFLTPMRRWLRRSAQNPLLAAGSGMLAALALQSSTAVALLTATFMATGAIAASVALAIMLGADVGSALVVQVLVVQVAWLTPTLLLAGVILFLRGGSVSLRMAGRILIGLALILVSLSMIRVATEPLRHSSAVAVAMEYLGGDPVTAFIIGALFAWAVQSSVAAVLLFVTLVAEGVMPMAAAVAMVLGSNMGSSLVAFVLTLGLPIDARRVVISNVALRGGGSAIALLVLVLFSPPLNILGGTPGQQVINLYLAFNLALVLVSLPFTRPVMRLATRLFPEPEARSASLVRFSALDPAALEVPARALTCAAREILRIGEEIESMLQLIIKLYRTWDDATVEIIRDKEKVVDEMHFETKLYLARLHLDKTDDEAAQRSIQLSTLSVNLGSAADVIARGLLDLARRMHDEKLRFSDEGWRELSDFHDLVLSNARASLNVLMTQDSEAARAIVVQKERVRAIEENLQRSHLERLGQGRTESIDTSNIHQETLRALKSVNTAFSMVAYPILSESGDLLSSRLAKTPAS